MRGPRFWGKRLLAALPKWVRMEARRWHLARRVRAGLLQAADPEYALLDLWVSAGDTVLDVGANVGEYTRRLSALVGPGGRVVAVEPVPDTAALLAGNTLLYAHQNVTVLNAAASDSAGTVGISIPKTRAGLESYAEAHVTDAAADLRVLSIRLDSLELPRVALAKIDAEGHEMAVLAGMTGLLERDRPVLILEGGGQRAREFLAAYGYQQTRYPGSPNRVFAVGAPVKVVN